MFSSYLLPVLIWASLAFCLHTYLIYPLLMRWLSRRGRPVRPKFEADIDFPFVSVIVCIYNEEKIIGTKVESLLALDYPKDSLRIYLGSDASTDSTNSILAEFAAAQKNLSFIQSDQRLGKPGLLNKLVGIAFGERPPAADHILLFTDANVVLNPQTLTRLARHFRDPEIAVVDAHMVHTGMETEGISRAENTYISAEVMLKYWEGKAWGCMVGPFGGCYAFRSNLFIPVPSNFLVDDFYLAMEAFEQGGLAISDLEATCYEAVSHDIAEEYRRKARISAGNFQNLSHFAHLWWPPFGKFGFAFFSHKVLRWLTPFFLIIILFGSTWLGTLGKETYSIMALLCWGAFVIAPCLDLILNYLNIHWLPLRGLRYFIVMNFALLEGFIKYTKGIKSNVWEPPKRH